MTDDLIVCFYSKTSEDKLTHWRSSRFLDGCVGVEGDIYDVIITRLERVSLSLMI